MPFRPAHESLQSALVTARQSAGLTQAEVAVQLGKPQSFVSKYETGERTLDVIEFLQVCEAVSCDPHRIIRELRKNHG